MMMIMMMMMMIIIIIIIIFAIILQMSLLSSLDYIFFLSTTRQPLWPPHYRGFMITLSHATLGRTPLHQ